ncbi:hypothetical protein GC174_10200 [bacterium]|nr:hypothetical protein [bacterium]
MKLLSSRKSKSLFLLAALTLSIVSQVHILPALAGQGRQKWDQQAAIRKVQSVIDQEKSGDFAWQRIAWLDNPEEAARRAQEEKKPIFVFFLLKTEKGPAAAPC